jgi:REP element-mobilizing transposase RayT
MALWRLYYHFVWSTKERLPLITPAIEPVLYGYIIGKANALGAIVHALGGVETHLHLVASIPPKLAISNFVKSIKGSSAHYINHIDSFQTTTTLRWQRGYGVFSLGPKQLNIAVDYTLRQKEHHSTGNLFPRLEEDTHEDDGPALWNYGVAITGIKVLTP